MGYEEKLEQIEAEVEAMDEEDIREDFDKAHEEFLEEHRDDAISWFLDNNYGGPEQEEEDQFISDCREKLVDKLIDERLTAEEKAEMRLDEQKASVERAEAAVAAAGRLVEKNRADVEYAMLHNKPKMLAAETNLRQSREQALAHERANLSKQKAALAELSNAQTV